MPTKHADIVPESLEPTEPTELERAQLEIEALKAQLATAEAQSVETNSRLSAEAALANAKSKRLEATLKTYAKLEEHLIPLPNGDLHRGFKSTSSALSNIDTEIIPESFGNPLDKAVAKCLVAAKSGNPLICIWCGMDYGIPGPQNVGGEKQLREHLVKDHPSIVEGYDKVLPEILMANLQAANARLAEATKVE